MGSYNLAPFILQGVRRTPTCSKLSVATMPMCGVGEEEGVAQGHKVWEGEWGVNISLRWIFTSQHPVSTSVTMDAG